MADARKLIRITRPIAGWGATVGLGVVSESASSVTRAMAEASARWADGLVIVGFVID